MSVRERGPGEMSESVSCAVDVITVNDRSICSVVQMRDGDVGKRWS